MKLFFLIIAFGWASICLAVRQQWTFHSEGDCTGEALSVLNKKPDVAFAAPIISNAKSYCMLGIWGLYGGINYANDRGTMASWDESNTVCRNNTWSFNIQSLRYLGSPDTTTHSLTLYEEEYSGGQEITISGPAFVPIPFEPKSLFCTGNTNWTFYTGNFFDGVATCFTPRDLPPYGLWFTYLNTINSTLSNVGSILRGCEGHIDQYFSP